MCCCNNKGYLLAKRLFDMFLALLGLTVFLPIALIIILAIFLQDGLPLFFYDRRVGKNGRVFKPIKFRSMIKDAEKITGSVYAEDSDARITSIGKILRATAMDELPQLINIFKGDMSFVGPRPEKLNYVEEFKESLPNYNYRHSVRPGLTGPAQVYLKYDSPQEDKLRHDLEYIDKANFCWDILLICKSFYITFKAGWEKFEKPNST